MGQPGARDEITKDNDINVSHCTFNKCKANEGGSLYFQDGDVEGDEETLVEYCTFDNCIAPTGSAIYCRSYKFELTYSSFNNFQRVKEDLSEFESLLFIYLNEAGIQPVIKNCTFYNNEQNIGVQSHGPISIEGGPQITVTFTQCYFIENNQQSNGDDSSADLEHIQSALVTFEGCVFEKNAGHCIMQQIESVCNTAIKQCTFNSNHGGSGYAIYSATTRSDNIQLMTVDGCIFANNVVTSSWQARGGAVSALTTTIKFTGVNQFIGNKVVYDESSERSAKAGQNIYTGACGGVLYIVQETDIKFELRGAQFSKCESKHYGGAIAIAGLDDEEVSSRLAIDIVDCQFTDCSSQNGGAIGTTIEGIINVEGCQFYGVSSENGGAIYCIDETSETPSTLSVKDCGFHDIKVTKDGGAFYCKSGVVTASGNNFTNCAATGKVPQCTLQRM